MKPTIRGFLLAVALAGVASSAPLCVSGTMADYTSAAFIAGGGCTVSDKLFTGFFYASTSGGNGVAVAAVNVNIVPDFSDPLNPGFHFSSRNWFVTSLATDTFNSFVDSSIGFSVQVISGLPLMDDMTLTLDSFAPSTGGAFGDIAETILPSGQQFG